MFNKPKKKKRPYNRRFRRLVYLFFILGIIIVAIGLITTIVLPNGPTITRIDSIKIDVEGEAAHSQIEQQFNINLPDTASNLHYYYKSYRVFFMQTRFDLPSHDVSAFLDSIDHMCFEQPLTDNLMPFGSPESKKMWWRPRSATQFMGAENCGDNPYWQLMIDQSDDDIWIVYILGYSQ